MGGPSADHTVVERVDPLVGVVIDKRYRIDTRLAQGGFGAIYRAHDTVENKPVALKVLLQRLVSDTGAVARFRREGATLTKLRSPYTIKAHAIGEAPEHGVLYIVMELLHGVSLFERFRSRGPIPWRTMARITKQMCHALGEAHELGIIHRDLKPTNVHLEDTAGDRDHVKVLDFGIAKILQAGQASNLESADLTNAGQMIGTLDYMSPEQMVGGTLTGQTDIYTVGIVMYEMLSGKRPFAEAPTVAGVLAAMLKTKPPSLTKYVDLPAALDRIVQKCLASKLEDRYADVRQLAADLDVLLSVPAVDNDSTRRMNMGDLRDPGASDGMTAVTGRPAIENSSESTVVSASPFSSNPSMTVITRPPPKEREEPKKIEPKKPQPYATLPGVKVPRINDAVTRKAPTVPPSIGPMPGVGGSDEEPTMAMGSRNPLQVPPPRRPLTASPPSTIPPPLGAAASPTPSPAPLPPLLGPEMAPTPPPAPLPPTPMPYGEYRAAPRLPPAPRSGLFSPRTIWIAVLVCAALLGIGMAARCA